MCVCVCVCVSVCAKCDVIAELLWCCLPICFVDIQLQFSSARFSSTSRWYGVRATRWGKPLCAPPRPVAAALNLIT